MQTTRRVIQLAKERALFRFSALAQPMVQDADNSITLELTAPSSGQDQKALAFARHFLRHEGAFFRKRFEAVFSDYLERAMQTMYRDLRLSFDKVSMGELTLIDDDTVNRQIEVDRLLLRMREADDEDLSRLNIMIAQLHGDHDVKERENPFRPYLIAHSLHQVLLEMVVDEAVVKILFEHLSNALANHLSEYYAAIRAVFESSGVQARLLARPGRMVRHQRYVGGSPLEPENQLLPGPRVQPGFQRIIDILPQASRGESSDVPEAVSGTPHKSLELLEFVRGIFNQTKHLDFQGVADSERGAASSQSAADAAPAGNLLTPASIELISKLSQFQQQAARTQAPEQGGGQSGPDQFELFSFGEQVDADKTSKLERITIDVVAMLFEFILEDEQIPVGLRAQIGRLQIPFLKAAMLEPALLQHAEHPARKLLNRMSSVAVGLDPDTPIGRFLADEMTRIVKRILSEFDGDAGLFSTCLAELELSLASTLRHADADMARSVQAVEDAEQGSEQLANTVLSLRRLLSPLKLEKRVSEFICQVWARVLCRESLANESPGTSRFRKMLPELVWSVREKQNADERSALIRLLPELVKCLKDGISMIRLPERECQQALDLFVGKHMEVLRVSGTGETGPFPSLEALRQYFSDFVVGQKESAPTVSDDPDLSADAPRFQAAAIEAALAELGIATSLGLDSAPLPSFESDAEWMAQMQLGICVERWSDDAFQVARLSWISANRTLYLFRFEQGARPIVYSATSLIKALREGSLRLVEYAPVFERAVDALLKEAEAMQSAR